MAARRLLITQTGSSIRQTKSQKATLQCLGLGRSGRSVQHEESPSITGMIRKVSHLVQVEEVSQPKGRGSSSTQKQTGEDK